VRLALFEGPALPDTGAGRGHCPAAGADFFGLRLAAIGRNPGQIAEFRAPPRWPGANGPSLEGGRADMMRIAVPSWTAFAPVRMAGGMIPALKGRMTAPTKADTRAMTDHQMPSTLRGPGAGIAADIRATGPGETPPGGGQNNGGDGVNTGVVVRTRPKTRKPAMYKVLMLNDDYTPMEFVVHVLERFFQKNRDEATRIMLHVHRRGVGVCGVFTYEVAETKVTQVMDLARQNQHPLQCTIEKE